MDHKKENEFIQEYLYIEEMPPIQVIQENKKEEISRGVHIINIFAPDEEK